jgi:type I site-specific restriction endonuclease
MLSGQNEAFSRVLIDKALEFSGWNLLDSHQVRFELNTATGRADYLLNGQRGPLSVLEGKREDVDPYEAKEQARGYAENVKAPFIILSNGREHWFWNYTRKDQDAYLPCIIASEGHCRADRWLSAHTTSHLREEQHSQSLCVCSCGWHVPSAAAVLEKAVREIEGRQCKEEMKRSPSE